MTDSRFDSRIDSRLDDPARPRGLLLPWLRAGAASAIFRSPHWPASNPAAIALLALLLIAMGVLLQRALFAGPAVFSPAAVNSGWLTTVLLLWVCWLVSRNAAKSPGTGTMFGVLLAQQIVISLPLWVVYLVALHGAEAMPVAAAWAMAIVPYLVVAWMALASAWLLWRLSSRTSMRALALATVVVMAALDLFLPPAPFWYPDLSHEDRQAAIDDDTPPLTQETLEAQSGALLNALNSLQRERPGVIDLYAITFAPYASEDVFSREATMVTDVMRTRFDAQGHVIQLQNHAKTVSDMPWATGLNLQRAIQRAASLMNREEDILFVHLTSHGAQDGQLAADFGPIEVAPVTPQQLKGWLDEAGVRWRVLSISACYSGSWIQPLADANTLVMTAADATHTSYGCGRLSELTFFGRAVYDEQLRRTHSFEAAHAAARGVIEQREKEAGKNDGYSNPQISVGEAIKAPLAKLTTRLDAQVPPRP
jgi:hypothetical protein